ncbi:hypothetical protein G6F37_004533 [Rhizopus arrhizus]|nr:hypothetical protein G6F37_004533 [Rhizopus arrhizus]
MQITQLVCYDNHIPIDIQTYALYALDAIARHRIKLAEVLNALNAAANHGILLHTLRRLSNESAYPQSFLDAFFTLLSYLTDTAIGGQMLSSAGIVNVSIHIIDNENIQPNVLTKVISLLDVAFDSLDNAYLNFFSSNGLNASIKALKFQIDTCINGHNHHDSIMLIKSILRFFIRMIKSSGAGSSLRNLMETSIPYVLCKIMEHHTLFGSTVFGLALSLYASYIHMEPTSLAVLQEVQVPQTFLKAFKTYDGYCDVTLFLNVIDAFSATCLNEEGLEMFQETQPLFHFFDLLSSSHFLGNPMEVADTSEIGGEMSEFVRHQPALKGQIFSCVHDMLQKVIKLGGSDEGKPEDNSHVLVYNKVPLRDGNAKVENRLLSMIEMVARFLEGFLEFGNAKEFINYNGHKILLQYYSLPVLPFDYYLSNAFGALSDVFKVLTEKQTMVIVEAIVDEVKKIASIVIKPGPSKRSSVADFIYVDGTNLELLKEGNRVFREFSFLIGHVGLLSSTLALLVLQKDEPCDDFIDWLYVNRKNRLKNNEQNDDFFELLGLIHRYLIWENILLRNAVPRPWYAKEVKLNSDGTAEEVEQSDLTDPKIVNTRRFAELLGGVSPVIMPLLQSIIKLEPYSNRNLSVKEGRKLFLISQGIANLMLNNFRWLQESGSSESRYDYVAAISALFSMLILEDKERRHMVSLVAVWFGMLGGVRWIIDNLAKPLWHEVEVMIEENQQETPLFERINLCLELLFPALHHLALPNLYSNHTLKKTAAQQKELALLFPENWLMFVRSEILKIHPLLECSSLARFPKLSIRALLGCVKQCLYVHGERDMTVDSESSSAHVFIEEGYTNDRLVSLNFFLIKALYSEPVTHDDLVQDTDDIPEDDHDEDYEDIEEDECSDFSPIVDTKLAALLLNHTRDQIRDNLPNILTQLVQDRDDLDFIVRDTLIALICGGPRQTGQNTKLMAQFFEGMTAEHTDKRALFESCINRIRIFALMLREPEVHDFAVQWVSTISNFVGWSDFLNMMVTTPEFPNPKWLTTLFLILETHIARSENDLEEEEEIDTDKVLQHDQATRLLEHCIQLLSLDILSEDNLLATLRILIRLTKRTDLVGEFLTSNGLEALLKRPRAKFESSIKVQQAYVIIILRHLIENKRVMEECMKEWLCFWARRYTSGDVSMDKIVKAGQAVFLRSPANFFNVCKQVCRIKNRANGKTTIHYIGNTENEDDNKENEDVPGDIESRSVIHFLLHELVKVQATESQSNWKFGYTGYLIECILELVSSYPSCKYDVISYEIPKDIEFHYAPDMVPNSDRSILNLLLNILVPFGPVNARTDTERKKKGIYIWTTGLLVALCYDTTHSINARSIEDRSSDESEGSEDQQQEQQQEQQKHQKERQNKQGTQEKKRSEMLETVRRHVLQAIARFFDYYIKAKAKNSKKYTKYYALSELCYHILNARPAAINPDYISPPNIKDVNVMDLSKLMLDNNFVQLLIDAIQDVDVNYPHAKTILNALLRPLEKLTKIASRLQQTPTEEDKEEEVDQAKYFDMFHQRSESPVDDMDELYRNSSMAILDGTAVEEEEEEGSSMDESSDDEDIEMASSGEEVIEIIQDEESTENESMNEVEDEEDEEDREMDELMRNHRHHLPDTDEEGSDSTDESSDEDEDGSPISYDTDDSSHLDYSEMSDDIESENDSDWRAANSELQREFSIVDNPLADEDQDTEEEEEPVDGVRGYDLAMRRRYANGSRNMGVNNHSNAIHIPSVTMALSSNNELSFRPGESSAIRDDIILHPLLRGYVSHSASEIKEALTGNASMSHLQPYEDIIGHGALFMLRSVVSSQNRRERDAGTDEDILDVDPGSQFISDCNTPTTVPTLEEDSRSTDNEDKNVLQLLLEFTPIATVDRWDQVTQMAHITSTAAAKTTVLAEHLINILHPDSTEENDQDRESMDEVFFDSRNNDEDHESHGEVEDMDEEAEQREDGIRVVIRGEEMDLTGSGLDTEFLEALPEDLRTEILNAQMEGHQPVIELSAEQGLDPEFLAALPDDVREDLLREEEVLVSRRRQDSEDQGEAIPYSPESHPGQTEEQVEEDIFAARTSDSRVSDDDAFYEATNDSQAIPPTFTRYSNAIRIVDRSQLAILTRLLFVPQSIVKALLNRLLLNLCENTKTRTDLLSLLICILQDECSDLAAVDRSFSRLFRQSDEVEGVEKERKTSNFVNKTPSLISQRCLEIIYYVITWNWYSLRYFLSENERFENMENGKHKYSFLVLIDLLRRPSFLNNSKLTEQLMEVLAKICHPIRGLVKQLDEKTKSGGKKVDPEDLLPNIPTEYFERMVRVLTTNECSSRTFRFVLSTLSNLSYLEEGFEKIIQNLKLVANQSAEQIFKDLEVLLSILEKLKTGTQMETSALKQFSTATAHQMKLLRVLNTMHFLWTRQVDQQNGKEKKKMAIEVYKELKFQPLWCLLGSCLRIICDKEDLMDVATVLLPLVECFMCIARDYYTLDMLADEWYFFVEFTEEHKKILNTMIRNNPPLMNGSFFCLVTVPKILEFDNKRSYFNEALYKESSSREKFPPLQLSIRRDYIFEDTYQQLQDRTGDEIRYGKLKVHFQDEEGVDEGGVSREWFSALARQMFDPNYALFITSAADKLTYLPNRASGVNPDHLSYFKFVGRVIGKAIHDGRLLDAYFTRSFYKLILGRSIDYKDLEAIDPTYYKSLVWMLENDITNVIDLTFSVETDDFGTTKTIDLKPDGRNIPVTEENKHEYVYLIAQQRLVLAIKPQMDAFLEGFHEIIPSSLISIFNEQELELLISGLPDIDIDDWKANTVYQGYNFQSPQIQWFWRAVRSFDEEERAKLLQFATGTSKVPLGGFSALQGSNGLQKFQIHKEFSDINRLPSAHTCFNQIDLPQYQNYEDLRRNLFKAISECSTGFGFV